LVSFFEFFGTKFNYENVGISIREGGFFFRKIDRDFLDPRKPFSLCVENPQDPTVDIGRSAYNIKKVQRAFQYAFDTLVLNNSNKVSLLKLIIDLPPDELKPGWRKSFKNKN